MGYHLFQVSLESNSWIQDSYFVTLSIAVQSNCASFEMIDDNCWISGWMQQWDLGHVVVCSPTSLILGL